MKPPVVLQKLTRLPRALWKWSKGRLRQGASFRWETFCPRKLQELMARRGWVAPGAVLGLEVDGKRVCAVELRRWGRRAVVLERAEAFELPEPGGGEVDVPTDETGDPGELTPELAAQVLQELEGRGFSTRELATVLSRERTFQRAFRLPSGLPEELEAMATLKGERELPLSPEDAAVDFLFVGYRPAGPEDLRSPPPEGSSEYLVLVCAAAKDVVTAATVPWAEAGFQPRALDVAGQSAFRVLRPLWEDDQEVVCLLCLRDSTAELVIGRQWPLFTRAIVPAGTGRPPLPAAARSEVVAEVQRSLRAFETEFPGDRVGRVILISRDEIDTRAWEEALALPVEAPARFPLDRLGVTGGPADGLPVGLAAALGAAWQELTGGVERVNFVVPRAERRQQTERCRRVKLGAAAAGVAVLVVLVPLVVLMVRMLTLARVDRQLAELAPQVRELEEVEGRLELLRPWTAEKSLSLETLAQITDATTAEVYFRLLSVRENGRLSLKGFAAGPEAAYQLVRQLTEGSKLLSDVVLEDRHAGSDSQFGHEFTLTAQVERWSARSGRERRQ